MTLAEAWRIFSYPLVVVFFFLVLIGAEPWRALLYSIAVGVIAIFVGAILFA